MRPHTWTLDGTLSDGEPRRRCSRCGMLGHWAGARDACPWLDNAMVTRMRMLLAPGSAAQPSARVEPPPAVDGRWAGPYREEPARLCKRCRQPYQRPARMNRVDFCGPLCKLENTRARVAAKMRETYHRRKLEEQP
jgi:hypothetical protein